MGQVHIWSKLRTETRCLQTKQYSADLSFYLQTLHLQSSRSSGVFQEHTDFFVNRFIIYICAADTPTYTLFRIWSAMNLALGLTEVIPTVIAVAAVAAAASVPSSLTSTKDLWMTFDSTRSLEGDMPVTGKRNREYDIIFHNTSAVPVLNLPVWNELFARLVISWLQLSFWNCKSDLQ